MLKLYGLFIYFIIFSTGCVTNKTAPSQVGWGDLIGPGRSRLDAHLDSKRYEIENRELYAERLDVIIDGYHITLNQLRNDLDKAYRYIKHNSNTQTRKFSTQPRKFSTQTRKALARKPHARKPRARKPKMKKPKK